VLPAQARLRRRPEFTAVVRSGRRAGRPTMVLHYLPERPVARDGVVRSARVGLVVGRAVGNSVVRHRVSRRLRAAAAEGSASTDATPAGARAGFVVGKAVGNSVVRHRVTRRLRAVVRQELHRLPSTADLVVRARPEAGTATSGVLHRDLVSGLDRLLGERVRHP